MKLYNLSIHELQEKISKNQISPADIVTSCLERIEEVEDKVKAFITITGKQALAQSNKETNGKLKGIPLAIKDNMSTAGIKTTCASKMLADYVPPYNATVIDKLNQSAAIIMGKTNLDEFAMGSSTENSYFYPTYNPWNLEHVAGGSSGGSAAAVAAGEAIAALGSDTGGSIRQPAAFCGVVGFKPTYGNVSRYGLITYGSSLDQIGTISKDVRDAAILLQEISGYDPLDSTSIKQDIPDYSAYLKSDVKGMKIALPKEFLELDFNEEIKNKVLAAVEELKKAGAIIKEVSLPNIEYALAAYYIIAPAEASSNLARYDGVRYGYRSQKAKEVKDMIINSRNESFGDEVKKRIMLGTYALSSGYYDAFYLKAQKVRTLIKEDFTKVFEEYDLLVAPTTPTTAFKVGEMAPLEMYKTDIFTVPVNIAGIPAISIPCGLDSQKLPIGLQIIGPHFGEGQILQAAYTLEKILDFKANRPNI